MEVNKHRWCKVCHKKSEQVGVEGAWCFSEEKSLVGAERDREWFPQSTGMFGAPTRHLDIVTSTHPIKDPSRGPDVANLEWESEKHDLCGGTKAS